MEEKNLRHCPNCPNHCREDGLSCVIGMNYFGVQPKPYWIKEDKKDKDK